jgi:hypothetical protein
MVKRTTLIVVILLICISALAIALFPHNHSNNVQAAVSRIPWMNGNTLWPVGVNLAWYNWDQDFLDNGWDTRFTAIKAQFDTMASQGVHAVRWWVFPDGNTAPLWSGAQEGSTCTGLPTNWVTHMVEMADYAKSKNIRIYFCFTSFDWGYNGRSWNHDDIFDNATIRKSFLDNAVKPILQALGTHEGVMGWDVINEPEWLIQSADGGDPNGSCESFSLANMRAFAKDVADYVHLYAKQGVSVGSASMKWCGGQYQFWTGLGLDFYDFHWYDWATPYFNPFTTAPSALGLEKPCIIGEMMPNPQSASIAMTHQQVLEKLYANGYAGYMPWAWNDSANDCKPYINPSFNNFEAAHPDVNQITGGTTSTPTPVRTPTPVTVTPTPVRTATPTATVTPTPVLTATPIRTATPRRATPLPSNGRTPTPVRRTPTPTRVPATPTPIRVPVTPTPTGVIVTATPTLAPATPTPVPQTGSIKIQFYNQSTASTTNQLYLNIKVVNTGSGAVTLSNVKIRYYYTVNGAQTQNFYCDYSPVGSSNVNGSFVTMATPKTGADTYVEAGFLSGAGSLAAGANTIIQARVAKSDWTNYTQTDDYSFNSSATTFVDWTKVTGYVSGALQWGTEP